MSKMKALSTHCKMTDFLESKTSCKGIVYLYVFRISFLLGACLFDNIDAT